MDLENHTVHADAMPAVVKRRDPGGRQVGLTTAHGDPIADFHLKATGAVDTVQLGTDLQLTLVKQGHQEYKETLTARRQGRVLSERHLSAATRGRPALVNLDAIARDLGLTANWANDTTSVLDSTGSLVTVRNRAGAALLYVVLAADDSVGYDTKGNVLFYDLATDIHSGPATDTDTKVDEFTFVPDHFILTRDGRLGAYVSTAAPDAIASIWTDRDALGNTIYAIRSGAGVTQPENVGRVTHASDGSFTYTRTR